MPIFKSRGKRVRRIADAALATADAALATAADSALATADAALATAAASRAAALVLNEIGSSMLMDGGMLADACAFYREANALSRVLDDDDHHHRDPSGRMTPSDLWTARSRSTTTPDRATAAGGGTIEGTIEEIYCHSASDSSCADSHSSVTNYFDEWQDCGWWRIPCGANGGPCPVGGGRGDEDVIALPSGPREVPRVVRGGGGVSHDGSIPNWGPIPGSGGRLHEV